MTRWWLLPALGRDTVEAVAWSGRKIQNPKSEMAMERKFLIPHSPWVGGEKSEIRNPKSEIPHGDRPAFLIPLPHADNSEYR